MRWKTSFNSPWWSRSHPVPPKNHSAASRQGSPPRIQAKRGNRSESRKNPGGDDDIAFAGWGNSLDLNGIYCEPLVYCYPSSLLWLPTPKWVLRRIQRTQVLCAKHESDRVRRNFSGSFNPKTISK